METLREIFIKLGLSVNAAEFAEGLAWEHALEKGAEKLKEAFEEFPELMKESIEQTAQFGEDMEVLAQKTGIGVEAIQKLGYAATLSHSSAEEMTTALGHLARNIEGAKEGSKEAVKGFTDLGISMEDVRTKSPEEMVFIIADRMKELGAGSKRTALAMGLLGRTGKNLIPTFDRGAEGLRAMGEEAEEMGNVMGDEAIKKASEFKEGIEKMEQAAVGLKHEFGSVLIEGLAPLLEGLLEWFKANRQIIGQKLQTFAHALGQALTFAGKAIMWVLGALPRFIAFMKLAVLALLAYAVASGIAAAASALVAAGNAIVNVGLGQLLVNLALNTLAYILLGAQAVIAAVKAAAAWAGATWPILLMTAALVVAALVAEDFWKTLKGSQHTLLSELGPAWTDFMDSMTRPTGDFEVLGWLKMLYQTLSNLTPLFDKYERFRKSIEDLQAPIRRYWGTQTDDEKELDAMVQANRIRAQQARDGFAFGPGLAAASGSGSPYVNSPLVGPKQQSDADAFDTLGRVYGNGANPNASASANASFGHAPPSFMMPVTIVQQPGQDSGALATELGRHFESLWDSKMRGAAPTAGVPYK